MSGGFGRNVGSYTDYVNYTDFRPCRNLDHENTDLRHRIFVSAKLHQLPTKGIYNLDNVTLSYPTFFPDVTSSNCYFVRRNDRVDFETVKSGFEARDYTSRFCN